MWLALYKRFSGKYCPDELEENRREINELVAAQKGHRNCERKTRFRTQLSDKVPEAALTTQCEVSVVQDLFGNYCPDELEENRQEMNELVVAQNEWEL